MQSFVFLLSVGVAFTMVLMRKGYEIVRKEWPELTNKNRNDVKQDILKDMPNLQFFEIVSIDYERYSEEFWYNQVRLVYDESTDVVTQVPKFFGQVPKLSLVPDVIGKGYKSVVDSLKKEIPDLKVIVFKNDREIFSTSTKVADYARLDVDDSEKVSKSAVYVRAQASAS